MIKRPDTNAQRLHRHKRVRGKISGTPARPRLCVTRSNSNMYVQVIDDRAGDAKGGITLTSASTMEKEIKEKIAGLNKTDAAKVVGATIAERAKGKGVETVVFDRGGYLYTGRVKALADGAREAGLKF